MINTRFTRLALLAALVLAGPALGQAPDEAAVVLPLEAQTCNLPNAPARVPPDADFEALTEAKPEVLAFQQKLQKYRACLDAALEGDQLTDGNRLALTRAHNYSVGMEERIAEQYNEAARNYQARQDADKD